MDKNTEGTHSAHDTDPNFKVGLQRPKSSSRSEVVRSNDDFADLEISSEFKPIKSPTQTPRDDYKVAMTGPAAFMDPAPEKIQPANKVENPQDTDSSVSVENVVESSGIAAEATPPQRSKLPIYAAIAASLVCVAVLGANSWPSATANGEDLTVAQSAAFGSVASLPTQVLGQQGAALSGTKSADDGVAPSSANSTVYSEGTHVAIALPANINDSVPSSITPQPVVAQPTLQALAAPKAEFTPLKSGITNVPEDYEGLSRSDCAARFKTVALSGAINFESGSATLLRSSQPILNFFGAVFEHCRHFTIEVAGHTDSVGNAGMNQELSEQRAESVAEYLVSIGVPGQNLRAVGYGEAAPIASNDTALKRSRNRRIEFTISDG